MTTNIAVNAPAVNVGVPSASLYVGDLHPEVTEAMLFEKFNTCGPVLSIRVCRDAVTRISLGYAYVNFQNHADAERALKNMNFYQMFNKPIRIMWSQRDPSVRRSGAGNIFIKNLDKHIDTKSIHDTFSFFGNILSCKVACDMEGKSKGYGFVHFETEEAAQAAIDKVNGMLLEGKPVFVGHFLPRSSRPDGEHGVRFNNIYVKYFPLDWDKERLAKEFEPYGEITSCIVMYKDDGSPKGFGFVCFKTPGEAEAAVAALNGKDFVVDNKDKKLVACRAQKKQERQAEVKRKYEQLKAERMQRYQGVNLYVKNLDDDITDETLRKHFEGFGKITSVKVMCDEGGRSKGFGFVCFEKPEDSTKAVVDMNTKLVGTKPIYVALAQRKEDRKAQLASQYMQRLAAMRMQNSTAMSGTMYNPANGGFFIQSAMQNQRSSAAAFMPAMSSAQLRGYTPRWNNVPHARGGPPRWNSIGTAGFSSF